MEAQLDELAPFLSDPRPNVRFSAAEIVLSLSLEPVLVSYIQKHLSFLTALAALVADKDNVVASCALKALVNLSRDNHILLALSRDDTVLNELFRIVLNTSAGHGNEAAMLLGNLSRSTAVCGRIAQLSDDAWRGVRIRRMISLLASPRRDRRCALGHLALVVANATQTRDIRRIVLEEEDVEEDGQIKRRARHIAALAEIARPSQKEADKDVDRDEEEQERFRRRGALAAIKHCCFETERHDVLLNEENGVLRTLLSTLSVPTDFTDDEERSLAPKYLLEEPATKVREPDNEIRMTASEALVLLCTTRKGRDTLRAMQTYAIVRQLHLDEEHEPLQLLLEELVNFLVRDESLPAGEEDPEERHLSKEELDADETAEPEEDNAHLGAGISFV